MKVDRKDGIFCLSEKKGCDRYMDDSDESDNAANNSNMNCHVNKLNC